MNLNALQMELETLPYQARIRRMIAVGREPRNAPLLDEMERGEFDLRWLALHSCLGSRDGARALRMLSDGSQMIRRCADAVLALIGSREQIVAALNLIPPKRRRNLFLNLYKHHRHDVIDACLYALAARDDDNSDDSSKESLRGCLAFGSPETVRRWLPVVSERFAAHQWARLARFQPDIALETLQAEAERADRPDAGLAYRANAVLPVTSATRPHATLTLLQTLLRHIPLTNLRFQKLTSYLPAKVVDLVLSVEGLPTLPMSRLLPRLDTARVLQLQERYHTRWGQFSNVLERLAPATRDSLYQRFGRGWENNEGCVAPSIIGLLSRDLREAAARRHLGLNALAARPQQRLPYAAFAPWEEARSLLDPVLRNPDPDLRVLAHTTLTTAARYHRSRLPELLAVQIARKNEQDPIRLAMLNGLAGLPPGLWKPEHLDDLALILRSALDAADLSPATAGAMETLVVKLLPFYPHWCAEWMATLAKERGALTISRLEHRLSDKDMQTLAPILLPVLRAWENREGWHTLLRFALSLGRRLRVFDALAVMLERMAKTPAAQWQSETALNLLAEHRRERLPVLVPQLLEEDPSWATRPVVYQFLHRHRQDLLTPFLGFKAYKGRFSTGKTRFALPIASGFERWTLRQRQIFAQVLDEVTRDTGRDTPSIHAVISQLAALPGISPTRLLELAALTNTKLTARDAALRALGQLDSGQGVATLLDAMGDDRGRIAIYALRHALLAMPSSRAFELLRNVPMEKVTVAKEVVRLLGELKTEAAYQELLALDARDLHRDTRIALLRGLWDFLEREQTWERLELAARNPEGAVAAHVSRIPATGLSAHAQQRLIGVLALLLQHNEARVRLDTLIRCATLPVTDREHLLLPHFLRAVGSPVEDERNAGAGAVFMTYAGRDANLVGETTRQLLSNRRALSSLVNHLHSSLPANRARLLPTARAVLDALQADPLTSQLRVRLLMQALPTDEQIPLLQQMAATRELHADALRAAMQALSVLTPDRKDTSLETLETALSASDDRYLRRLALAALAAQGASATGWTAERLARLRVYRADPAPLVAEAAQFTFPPGEEES